MVKTNIQSFPGEVEILSNLHVGSYLTANGAASNVLEITGNVGATFFIGDGGFLSNIATTLNDITNQGNVISNVVTFEANTNYGGVGLVTSSNVGIQNTNPIHTLDIGDKVVFDDSAVESSGQSVIRVDGRINATRFEGDGGLLSNIATTLSSIVNQGNTASNVVIFNAADEFDSGGVGLVTNSNVGIQNTSPTFNLSVGSNLHVDDTGANVLTVHGNVTASNLNLGVFSITPAYGLNDVCSTSNGTSNVVQFQNSNTSIVTTSNINVGGQVIITGATKGLDVTSNIELGGRLKFDSNVFIDTLRVADVATNLVTYDQSTGELLDSGGTFLNKFAVVSEQPPSDLFANTTTVTNHGGYTLTTSNLATNSNTYNAFDGTANAWTGGTGMYVGGSNVLIETNLTQLSNLHPTQFGDWLAIEFPYKTTLRHMKLTPATVWQSFPYAANLYATNNDLTWTEIKYWDGLNPGSASNVQTITVNATEQFKKYALVTTKLVPNTNVASAVALQDWQLFTESFSIDGGKVEMATSAVMGGETTMDQHGPHSRDPKAVPLKKYPEIVFEEGKFDRNDSTNTYVQAGYTVSSSSKYSSNPPHFGFSGSHTIGWISDQLYDVSDGSPTASASTTTYDSSSTATGEWIQLKIPKKIKLTKLSIGPQVDAGYSTYGPPRTPKSLIILGSNNGTGWTSIFSGSGYSSSYFKENVVTSVGDIINNTYYTYYRLIVTSTQGGGYSDYASISEIELYGYEEDPPAGDTSVDTTFTSIMNTPQTTGANVYVDGNLGETFTNRVTGPDATGPSATYDETGKYWELNGELTSNLSVEANTFLSGDAPHSLSMWFNSSNLEANVSNTCVFSVSDQEHLNSENLDLQSNTWHNLTYAYQGEGGSRVTYLDGRKVAEDQAEDTFGDYPPFAMTGYSQGGYVVSSNSENSGNPAWEAFDSIEYGAANGEGWETAAQTYRQSGDFEAISGGSGGSTVDTITDTNSGQHTGYWIKIEFPQRIRIDYARLQAQNSLNQPKSYVHLFSNNDQDWDLGYTHTTGDWSQAGLDLRKDVTNTTKYYKYAMILVKSIRSTGGTCRLHEIGYYGHRENDLVRLPDPTNVLKYPHIAFPNSDGTAVGSNVAPSVRGYVATTDDANSSYPIGKVFDERYQTSGSDAGQRWQPVGTHYASNGGVATSTNLALTTLGNGTTYRGNYIQLESPHKLNITKYQIYSGAAVSTHRPTIVVLVGSNTGNTNDWVDLGSGDTTLPAYSGSDPDYSTTATISNTGFYKYHRLVIRAVHSTTLPVVFQVKFFGTEENSSIPIQIGGGNIDKVANFRVYDKFIDQNQALEIWDAQKDEFGRVKSSMTLQKGRLGIGTDEPEGRLAVLDEPHNLEEFPPRAMTGYKTHFEGHGEFCASASSYYDLNTYPGWKPFNHTGTSDNYDAWLSADSIYTLNTNVDVDPSVATNINGVYGEWLELKLPYKIILDHLAIKSRGALGNTYGYTSGPAAGNVWGSNDGLNWTLLSSFTGFTYKSLKTSGAIETLHVNSITPYSYFRLQPTKRVLQNPGYTPDSYVAIGELRYFGTREQGQSVLHDGQLTLTKSLTVPRIGPALDADDTPRRDRLVVEYNTSTNPTFEGAVRDTSGRGNDGVFVGTASYDATEKNLVTPGNATSAITSGILKHLEGQPTLSYAFWFNQTATNGNNCMIVNLSADGAYGTAGIGGVFLFNTGIMTSTYGGQGIQLDSALSTGTWRHVVAVCDGPSGVDNMTIYINGEKPAQSNWSTTGLVQNLVNPKLRIGGAAAGTTDMFDGKISNFKLYDTVLTAEEVKTLYDMGRCDEGHHMVNFSKTRVRGLISNDTVEMTEIVITNPAQPSTRGIYSNDNATRLHWAKGVHDFEWGSPGNGFFYIRYNGAERGYFHYNTGNFGQIDFTGQHRSFIDAIPQNMHSQYVGMIVCANKNKYYDLSSNTIITGNKAINVSEALPLVSLSNVALDKTCYGVISNTEYGEIKNREYEMGTFVSVSEKPEGDNRAIVNSVGEGAIWVVNTNGPLESGDYITTSNVAGYGQKQDDDVLHNYTVAKITMDCDFNPATQPIQQILRSNVIQTYYLGNVHHTKTVPHEFVTTTVTADDTWSNVSVSPSDTTYAEWSNLEANTQNTYTLTYTQTSNVVYDTKYTLTTTANVTESDAWDRVSIDPPGVTYAEYSNLEANTQSSYSLTFTKTTTDEKTPDEWSALESNTQSLYNMVYYQSVEEEVAATWPGATTHTRLTDVIENELDAHGQIQWEDHATETEKAYKIRYLDASGVETDSANVVHIAAFVGCTYHCG